MEIEFNHEHFEAWLLSQNPSRAIDLVQGKPTDQPGCLLCNFARETLPGRWNSGWISMGSINKHGETHLVIMCPEWIGKMIGVRTDKTTMGEMQTKYRELFPDTTPEPTPAIAEAVRK